MIPIQEVDQLLKPDRFDWAEDAEDLQEDISNTTSDPLGETQNTSRMDKFDVESERVLEEFNPSPRPQIVDDKQSRDTQLEFCLQITSMQEDVRHEYNYRDTYEKEYCGDMVHHFNWFGCPVSGHSSTPPEISLWFLLAEPKVLPARDELRLYSIMQNALVYIDPVIVSVEGGFDLFGQTGFHLVRSAKGRTYKFYSPHGWWVNDLEERNERTETDEGNVLAYMAPHSITGNGFVESCNIRTRKRWSERKLELENKLYSLRTRLGNWVHNPSPLRQSVTAEDLEDEAEDAHLDEAPNDYLNLEVSISGFMDLERHQEHAWVIAFLEREGKLPEYGNCLRRSFKPHLEPIKENENREVDSDSGSVFSEVESDITGVFDTDESSFTSMENNFSDSDDNSSTTIWRAMRWFLETQSTMSLP